MPDPGCGQVVRGAGQVTHFLHGRDAEAAGKWCTPRARCRDVCAGHIEGRVDDQNRSISQHPPIPPEWSNHMTEPAPRIDFANIPAPAEGILVTLFITVRKVARSRDFYSRVLGGTVVLDENPCIVRLSNSWIIMNPGGPPTPDKPGISVVDYQPGDTTSLFLNLRVADIQARYEEWKAKGAEFVTPPIDREAEIRCYLRDPDGYLIEVGQSTGLLHGKLAAKRPEDLPG
jgi:catechol 2,3-dioxygenase-like lactoylglutathione lyase family enzyme